MDNDTVVPEMKVTVVPPTSTEPIDVDPKEEAAKSVAPAKTAAPTEVKAKVDAARFAALSVRERELLNRQAAVKAREAEIQKAAETSKAIEEAVKQSKKDPLKALKALGLTYDDVTKFVLNDQKPTVDTEVAMVRSEFEEFKAAQKAEREAAAKEAQERAAKERQKIVDDFKASTLKYVEDHPDDCELIVKAGVQSQIFSLIEAHYEDTKTVMTVQEAANLVESQLMDLAEQIQSSKKWTARQQKKTPVPTPKTASKTLTNGLSASTPARKSDSMTDAERRQRAIEAFNRENE